MPCAGALKHIYASGGRSFMPRMQVQRALVSVCLLLEESVKSCARGGESSLLETDPAPAAGQRLAGDGAQRCPSRGGLCRSIVFAHALGRFSAGERADAAREMQG